MGERSSRSKSEYRDHVSGVFGGRCSSYLGLQWCLRKNVEEITRKTYGKGKKTEELRVEGKDRVLGEIPIEVTEQVYGEQEISQVLKQAVKKIDSLILAENISLDHVDRDLNLLTEIPGKPIDVTWKLDRYDVINIYGKLKEDKLVSEGTPVKLTAILTYREDVEKQVLYECMAIVYPRMTGSDGALLEKVRRTVAEKDQDTRESGTLTLPETGGRTGNTFLYGNELERCSNYGGCS